MSNSTDKTTIESIEAKLRKRLDQLSREIRTTTRKSHLFRRIDGERDGILYALEIIAEEE